MIKKVLVLIVVFTGLSALLGSVDGIFSELRDTSLGDILYGATLGVVGVVIIFILGRVGLMPDLFKVFKGKINFKL